MDNIRFVVYRVKDLKLNATSSTERAAQSMVQDLVRQTEDEYNYVEVDKWIMRKRTGVW